MRITLVALVALSSVFVCQGLHLKAATFTSEIADIKPRNDLLLNLLPLYGHLKLKYILSRKNYNTAAGFFKSSPAIYEDFKTNLAPLGIIVPDIDALNTDVVLDSDFDIIYEVVGNTNIRDAIEPDYLEYLKNWFDTHPDQKQALINIAIRAGITIPDVIPEEQVAGALGNAFLPNVSSFIPTIISIAVVTQGAQIWGDLGK